MSISDSRDTTAQQMLDLSRRNQREVAELRNALADEQDRRRKTQGELNILKGRLESVLSRLEDRWDCKVNPQICTAEQQNAALDITTTIRKELDQ